MSLRTPTREPRLCAAEAITSRKALRGISRKPTGSTSTENICSWLPASTAPEPSASDARRTFHPKVNDEISRLSALARGGFQCAQVQLDHPHHRLHGFGMTNQLINLARHNLPTQSKAVGEPAAGIGLSAFQQLVPVAVYLFLGVATNKE